MMIKEEKFLFLSLCRVVPESAWAIVSKYHKLSGLNNKHLFFTVLGAGKFKIKVLVDLVSW